MKHVALIFLLLFFFTPVEAQESMVQDISYPYLDKLIEIAKKNYPSSKVIDKNVELAQYGVKKAKLSYFEALSFSYLFNPASNTTSSSSTILNGYKFGFLLNVGSLLQRPIVIKQAKGDYEISQLTREGYYLNLEADVKKRYFTYLSRIAALRVISGTLLDLESNLNQIKFKFEKGEETLNSYNQAIVVYSNQVQNKIIAETDLLISKSSLEELLGQRLENIK